MACFQGHFFLFVRFIDAIDHFLCTGSNLHHVLQFSWSTEGAAQFRISELCMAYSHLFHVLLVSVRYCIDTPFMGKIRRE